MMYAIVGVLCGCVGFIAGCLVYRNNFRIISEKVDELARKIEAVRDVTR